MKSTVLLLLAIVSIQLAAFSQTKKPAAKPPVKDLYTFYTIENGVKTKVAPDSKITIPIGEDGLPKINLGLEIDVQAFHKKYPYDVFAIYINNYTSQRPTTFLQYMNFIDEGSSKLLAQTVTKKYTLYPEKTGDFKDADPMSKTEAIYIDWQGDSMGFVIAGAYSNGTETYYDEYSNSVKTKHVFTKYTDIEPVPTVFYDFDQDYINEIVNGELMRGVQTDYYTFHYEGDLVLAAKGYLERLQENAQHGKDVSGFLSTATIEATITEFFNVKYKEICKETDATAFMNKWVAFVTENAFLNLEKLPTEAKKSLEKALKKSKDASLEERVQLIKAANPNPSEVLEDYKKLMPH